MTVRTVITVITVITVATVATVATVVIVATVATVATVVTVVTVAVMASHLQKNLILILKQQVKKTMTKRLQIKMKKKKKEMVVQVHQRVTVILIQKIGLLLLTSLNKCTTIITIMLHRLLFHRKQHCQMQHIVVSNFPCQILNVKNFKTVLIH